MEKLNNFVVVSVKSCGKEIYTNFISIEALDYFFLTKLIQALRSQILFDSGLVTIQLKVGEIEVSQTICRIWLNDITMMFGFISAMKKALIAEVMNKVWDIENKNNEKVCI